MIEKQPDLTHKRVLTLFVDGASRGNPGASGIGIFCRNAAGTAVIKSGFFTGAQTCNQAEYSALLYAFFFLSQKLTPEQQRHYHINVTADSLLLIKQMRGEFKVKEPTLKILWRLANELSKNFSCSFKHVLREFNTQADELANLGVDSKTKPPKEFLTLLANNSIFLDLEN